MDEGVRMNVLRTITASGHAQGNADLLARPGSSDRPARMRRKHKVAFVTIVPSPYQRDLFGALAAREEVDVSVYYLESAAPDSPAALDSARLTDHGELRECRGNVA